MRNRWYDPTVQRFIGRDLLAAKDLYLYALNAPTVLVDTTGRAPSVGGKEVILSSAKQEGIANADATDVNREMSEHPGLTLKGGVNPLFNCIDYALRQSGLVQQGNFWFNTNDNPWLFKQLQAGGYITQDTTPQVGDLIVYAPKGVFAHIGVVVGTGANGPVIDSKWGTSATYEGNYLNVPASYLNSGQFQGVYFHVNKKSSSACPCQG
jgi:hypothetical protein